MQINSPSNLDTLYGVNQPVQKTQPQPAKADSTQSPASNQKVDIVSISTEALSKQAKTKQLEAAAANDVEGSQKQQTQTTSAPSQKNSPTPRIDLMA